MAPVSQSLLNFTRFDIILQYTVQTYGIELGRDVPREEEISVRRTPPISKSHNAP